MSNGVEVNVTWEPTKLWDSYTSVVEIPQEVYAAQEYNNDVDGYVVAYLEKKYKLTVKDWKPV